MLRFWVVFIAIFIVASACNRTHWTSTRGGPSSPTLEIVQVDSGVVAAIRKELLSLAVNSNSLIIVRDTDVVVVDAPFTHSATQETIATIRSITDKPVGYVINTRDQIQGVPPVADRFEHETFASPSSPGSLQTGELVERRDRNKFFSTPALAD